MGCSSSNTSAEPLTQSSNDTSMKTLGTTTASETTVVNNAQKYPASEAFIVSLKRNATTMINLTPDASADEGTTHTVIEKVNDDDDNGGDNKDGVADVDADVEAASSPPKPPPKRIQRLIEEAAVAAEERSQLTLDDLEEKQRRAEERRRDFMQQKLETIQKTTQMLVNDTNDNVDGNTLPDRTVMVAPLKGINDEPVKHLTKEFNEDIEKQALDDDSKRKLLTSKVATLAN